MNIDILSKVCLTSSENNFLLTLINKTKYRRKLEGVHEKPELRFQAFIQEVLLITVFERGLSFRMFFFMKNDREIILRCKWRSEVL